MNRITITLTKSKSFIATDSNQPDRYMFEISNPSGTKVVTAENNSTEILVIYPDEFAGYTKYVDLKNTRSATDGDRIKFTTAGTEFTFTIPDSMTFAGYTFLHFVAALEDERAIWDRVAIKIWSTSPNWTGEAAGQPDILIKALQTAQRAESKIDDAIYILNNLRNPATGKFDTLQNTLDSFWGVIITVLGAGITVGQFDGLELLASEFDGSLITTFDFDFNGYKILGGL